jgi:3-dehydroquinate synthase
MLLNSKIKEIKIKTNGKDQRIIIGEGVRSELFVQLKNSKYTDYLLIVDTNLAKIHKDYISDIKEKLKISGVIKVIPSEQSKSLDNLQKIVMECYEASLKRSSCIIAIGGGIVGDISGVLASMYMRGIDYIFIPTTLMSQADTIVSKVAISYKFIKNILGSFYSPTLTICDVDFLKTLPRKEISMGMSEVIKSAFIDSESFVKFLDINIQENLINWKEYPWTEIIYRSLQTKARLAGRDFDDKKGLHKGLSYGHTFANVYEGSSDFQIRHGEAVGLGMRSAGFVSNKLGMLNNNNLELQNSLLTRVMLPAKLPTKINNDLAIEVFKKDKLSLDGKISLVIVEKPGKFKIINDVNPALVKESVDLVNP